MIYYINILPTADIKETLLQLSNLGVVNTPFSKTPRYVELDAPFGAHDQINSIAGVECSCCDEDVEIKLDLLNEYTVDTIQALTPEQWGLGYLSGSDDLTFYAYDATGQNIVVANVDTPADNTTDFGNRFEKVHDPYGIPNTTTHGTATLGIAGGALFGAAKGALLKNFAGFRGDGSATTSTLNGAFSAVADYAEQNPNQKIVLNCSFSASGAFLSNPFSAVIDRLKSLGVIIVASAGNDNINYDGFNLTNVWPAMDPDVICVAAHDLNSARASFSSYGGNTFIFAPGVDNGFMRADGTIGVASGTSFSAPYTAGCIACALEAGITDVRAWLRENAVVDKISGVSSGNNDAVFKPPVLLSGGVSLPSGAEPEIPVDAVILDARFYDFTTNPVYDVTEDGYVSGFNPFHIIDERNFYG